MTTLVLAAHGSRDPRFAATMERIADTVRARLGGVDVRLAYLDLNTPSVSQVLAGCRGEVLLAPLLLSEAFHSKIDLPALVEQARLANPTLTVRQLATLGSDARIVTALAERLDQVGVRPTDGVLMTAVGSSDAAADDAVRQRAIELALRVGAPVELVFATRLGHDNSALRAAIARLRRGGARRMVVSPYFLSAGLLTERVDAAVDSLASGAQIAGPLGAHPALVEVVCDRYRAALPVAV